MKRLFAEEEVSTSDDSPWHNEYVKDKNNIGNETMILRVVDCAKGLMLLGEDFKDFIFHGKKTAQYLKEALEHYSQFPSDSIPLLMEASKSKNAILGILEDYSGKCVWVKDDKGYRFLDTQASTPVIHTSNPFLLPTMEHIPKRSGGTPRNKKLS